MTRMNATWVVLCLVVVAIVAGAAVFMYVRSPQATDVAGDNANLEREIDPAVSTRARCEAACRDQYGGSGSAGFDACIRGCGAGEAAGARVAPSPTPATPTPPPTSSGNGKTTSPAPTPTPPTPVPTPSPTQNPPAQTPTPSPSPTPTPAPAPTPTPPAPKTVQVSIVGFAFSPASVTLNAGDTVVFTNRDAVGHTATANGGAFDTGILQNGESKSVTLTQKGSYNYFCIPHPGMTATLIVE